MTTSTLDSHRSNMLDPEALGRLKHPTPYLAMSLPDVTERYQQFRRVLPDITIHFAIKCNPNPDLAKHLHGLGSRFEIASIAELKLLQAQGVPADHVIFSNPIRPAEFIAEAHAAGVKAYSFDSDSELDKLAQHAPGARVYARLATVPANSQVPSEGKFGVGAADTIRLLVRAAELGLEPYGLAFHVGSQMLHPTEFAPAIQQAGQVMAQLRDQHGITLHMLDIGGGFPAHYEDADTVPDLAEFAKVITEATREHVPYPVELVIEPGRALVADAGVMVTRVLGVAPRLGKTWVHLDAGAFNGFMEVLETQNQLRFPLADSRGSAEKAVYHITGPSCDSQDTVMFDAQLSADLAVDDLVYVYTTGAYTTSYASNFNGFDIPLVHCLK